jgi:hypothetical protein
MDVYRPDSNNQKIIMAAMEQNHKIYSICQEPDSIGDDPV